MLDPAATAFLDALEVTQGGRTHSVPLAAGRPTVVRAYPRYAPAPVAAPGERRVARTARGPWQTIASLGSAQLDPSRSGRSLADRRSRRTYLGFSLNVRLLAELTAAGTLWAFSTD